MMLAVIILLCSFLIELCFVSVWRIRWLIVWLLGLLVPFATVVLVIDQVSIWSMSAAVISAYRMFNISRIAGGRGHEAYLKHSGFRTTLMLCGLQFIFIWSHVVTVSKGLSLSASVLITAISIAGLVSAASLLISTLRSLRKTRPVLQHDAYSDRELPTITVAIPARNETQDLEHCLAQLVETDYPKLEILVLDDCSQERRTPEIIRSFANKGVRFLAGTDGGDVWLPKNHAYQQLSDEASGEYIVFCGVDIVFAKQSLRELVSILVSKQKLMMGVLPERSPLLTPSYSLVQPMRYWWELAPPRRLFKRPPALSSCWIINREFLQGIGGFKAVSRSILPEAYMARRAVAAYDGYSFVRSAYKLGITSVKSPVAQRDTAVRTRYPQLHRRIEWVLLLSAIEISMLVLPYVFVILGLFVVMPTGTWMMSIATVLLLTASYQVIVSRVRLHNGWFGLVAFPFVVLTDVGLLHYSMWKYEFSSVTWKGRNVCVPVMHVIPRLPELPPTQRHTTAN